MLKEAIDRILMLAEPRLCQDNMSRWFYNSNNTKQLLPPLPSPVVTQSLTGLLNLLVHGADVGINEPVFVHVRSHSEVTITSCMMDSEQRRKLFGIAKYETETFKFNGFLPAEQFNIAMQAFFVPTADVDSILKITGNIIAKAEVKTLDNGYTQAVTTKSGIARVEETAVQSTFLLQPFRTFPEIKQPAAYFILRLRQNPDSQPTIGLFEAGSDEWKASAVQSIKAWFGAYPDFLVIA